MKWLAIAIVLALVLAALAYKSNVLSKLKPSQIGSDYVSEKSLPLSSSILTNPLIYQWKGELAGAVSAKTDKSFTLTSKGSSLKVTYIKGYTSIYDVPSQNEISLNQLAIGTLLRGEVWITSKAGVGFTAVPNDPVGGVFYVDKTAKP